MVIFLYVTSVMSTLKVKTKFDYRFIFLFVLFMFIPNVLTDTTFKTINLSDTFNTDRAIFVIIILYYLILRLIAVVSISKKFDGSLKSKINV